MVVLCNASQLLRSAALTEKTEASVCKNWIRIVGVKREDSRMDELRKEIGVQISLTGRLARSQLVMWYG